MVKNKKPIINPKNNDDKYFQYAVTTTLNYQNNPKRISKVKPFIDQYHWKKKFPSDKRDRKKSQLIIGQLLLISYMCLIILKK